MYHRIRSVTNERIPTSTTRHQLKPYIKLKVTVLKRLSNLKLTLVLSFQYLLRLSPNSLEITLRVLKSSFSKLPPSLNQFELKG